MKIAFIGLGIMGSRMASNLARNNVSLTVYNRTRKEIETFGNQYVTIADSPKSAVKDADIVFSMLSTPDAVEEVFFGTNGALNSMKENAIWVDCTTVNPSFSLKAAEQAELNIVRFLDAPVSGSKIPAENAELVFLVGGLSQTLKEAEPYMNMMGNRVLHIGDNGKGASYKMIINAMLAQSVLIFSEAVLLGERMGITREFLLEALPNSVVGTPVTKLKAQNIKNNDYDAHFPLEWMLKDLHLAAQTAYEVNQPLFLSNLSKEIYTEANKAGMGRLDMSAIFKYLEERK